MYIRVDNKNVIGHNPGMTLQFLQPSSSSSYYDNQIFLQARIQPEFPASFDNALFDRFLMDLHNELQMFITII